MSWFSELAGKAEAFLERVDQAAATTIQNAQTPSHDVPDSQGDEVDSHIGELHNVSTPANDGARKLEYTKSHSFSDLSSMVQTQPKPPKDLARVGHVSPVKYFTPGASNKRSAPPSNTATLNDSWLEYLNSPSNKQTNEKAARPVKETITVKDKQDGGEGKPVNKKDNIPNTNEEIPDITVTGKNMLP